MTDKSMQEVVELLRKNMGLGHSREGRARNALACEIIAILPNDENIKDSTLRLRYREVCRDNGRKSATIRRLRDEILAMRRKLDLPKLLDEKDAEIIAATSEAIRFRKSRDFWYGQWGRVRDRQERDVG